MWKPQDGGAARVSYAWGLDASLEAGCSGQARGTGGPCPEATLKVAQLILDRTGYHAKAEVEVSQKVDSEWLRYLEPSEMETLSQLMDSARARMPEHLDPVSPQDGVH